MKESKVYIKAKSLPEEPGVYQFFDKDNEIIYIGKAKNLKKRVSSYFTKSHDTNKLKLLVKSIDKIERIIVDTEMDALLLENNLIKKYKPKYNVLLKDDKSYPCEFPAEMLEPNCFLVVGELPSNPLWNPIVNCLLAISTAVEPVIS